MLNYTIVDNNHEKWITLIHCLGGSIRTWQKQALTFSNKYNLLLIDLPYHGKSLDFAEELTNENINLAIKEVLDFTEIKKSHFIGFSLGTIVIANFVSAFPEYVESAVLGGCSIAVAGIYKPLVKCINSIKYLLPCKFAYKFMATIMLPKNSHKKSRDIFIREIKNMNKQSFHKWIKYISQITDTENLFRKLNDTKVKILILSGDRDFAFFEGAKRASKILKHSYFSVLHKCGHVCIVENPDLFNQKTLSFIQNTC